MDQTEQAKETHRMEIVNDIYKKLHDLDYFLLRYGPKDVAKYVEDDSRSTGQSLICLKYRTFCLQTIRIRLSGCPYGKRCYH